MPIEQLADWFDTPSGRRMLTWEQLHCARVVADIFGFNAVQLGLPGIDYLAANRMPLRLVCAAQGGVQVCAEDEALPFATASLDLVLLPHRLEFSARPHQLLREVERVLVPEGSVVIIGFNPYSLHGLRRLLAQGGAEAPWRGQYLSLLRLKDWLTLLGFETQSGAFGCYAPPLSSEQWLARWAFMERLGERWWPFLGGVYLLQAIKRVQGMRLITPNWRERRERLKLLAPAVQRSQKRPDPTGHTG